VSRYQKGKTNLDFTEARDSEWRRHQLGHMQVCTSPQTDNHASTPPLSFTGRMPFLPPNQQRQSTEGTLTGKETSFLSINKVNCTLIVHIVSLLTSSQKFFRMFSICMQSFSPLVDCCVKNVLPQTMSDVN